MNKRRRIYKGLNKRRKDHKIKIILIATGICIVSGYGYIKIKDSKFIEEVSKKVSTLHISKVDFKKDTFLGIDDYGIKEDESEEVDNLDDINEENKINEEKEEVKKQEEKEQANEAQEIKRATVDPLNLYTIQVASIQENKDIDKIENELLENKIPFSIVEVDGVKKVQTYTFFEKEVTREYTEKVKEVFPDAFISEIKVPVLSLEYTTKYAYIENISIKLNELIKNFEKESEFWSLNKENNDLEKYNNILTSRKEIILEIQKEAERIDYSNIDVFKENLLSYTKSVDEKIDQASKAANEKQYNISESLYLSSMQEYLLFINSIQKA